jgi:threonine-phosphate decarboxylase
MMDSLEWRDYSINTNPLDLPPDLLSEVARALPDLVRHYAQPNQSAALTALAAFVGVPPECLTISCGATEAIRVIPQVFAPKLARIIVPTFWEYKFWLEATDCLVDEVQTTPQEGFRYDSSLAPSRPADLGMIANVNNPTGSLLPRDSTIRLREHLSVTRLVIDETYLLFRSDLAALSLAPVAAVDANFIVLASLSKFFHVPGLRLGYIVSTPDLAQSLRQRVLLYGVSTVSLAFLERMVARHQFIRASRDLVRQERGFMLEALRSVSGLSIFPGQANFLLIEFEESRAGGLQHHLAQRGMRVRHGSELANLSDRFIRIALRSHRDNEDLVTALAAFAGERE